MDTSAQAIRIALHPKQWAAFLSDATEILYGGAAGGGKSHLMRQAAIAWCSEIPGLQVYLFRRIRDDLVKNHMEGPKGFRALLAGWVDCGFVTIVEDEIRFWNGSKIYLCHCKDEKDRFKYQGSEIHVLLVDELTHFTDVIYRFLRNRVRMVGVTVPERYRGKFPRIICGANPGGIGHQFVKMTFIDGAKPMEVCRAPRSEGGMIRQFIPAQLEDNPSMAADDPGYDDRLHGLGSESLVRAMRYGDWDIIDGAFFDNFRQDRHVVRPFVIPDHWLRFGPDAVLADTGPSMLGLAQGVGARPGEGRTIITDALRARNEGTNARVYGDVSAALGPAEDAQAVTNAIANRRSQVDAVNYGKALDNAPAVDTTALLANLGKAIDQSEGMEKKALISARDYLMTQKQAAVLTKSGAPMYDPVTGEIMTELRPAPKDAAINLHKIKGELDNVIQYGAPGLGVPAGALERQQGALKTIRGQLNDALEQQVPGYAEANAQSAALARRAEAVQAGTGILDSGKTAPSPGRFADDFGAMVPGEQIAFNKGARAEVDRQLGTKVNDLVALKGALQGEGGWNTAKIGTAFGDDAANALVASVDRNTKFRDTFNKVVENSQTAQRSQAAKALEDGSPVKLTSDTLYGDAKRLLLKPANAVLQALLERNNAPRDAEIARFLSSGGSERDRNLSALVDAISRTQQLKQSADAKGSIGVVAAALAARAGLGDRQRAQ